jgi:hypothetical protein
MSSSAQDLLPPPSEVNDSHKVYSFGIMCSLMCALGTISVLGRLAIRYHFRNFGADDYAIIPALVRSLSMSLCHVLTLSRYYFFLGVQWQAFYALMSVLENPYGRSLCTNIQCG